MPSVISPKSCDASTVSVITQSRRRERANAVASKCALNDLSSPCARVTATFTSLQALHPLLLPLPQRKMPRSEQPLRCCERNLLSLKEGVTPSPLYLTGRNPVSHCE